MSSPQASSRTTATYRRSGRSLSASILGNYRISELGDPLFVHPQLLLSNVQESVRLGLLDSLFGRTLSVPSSRIVLLSHRFNVRTWPYAQRFLSASVLSSPRTEVVLGLGEFFLQILRRLLRPLLAQRLELLILCDQRISASMSFGQFLSQLRIITGRKKRRDPTWDSAVLQERMRKSRGLCFEFSPLI